MNCEASVNRLDLGLVFSQSDLTKPHLQLDSGGLARMMNRTMGALTEIVLFLDQGK
jgi:hypothetical protein